ncbi:hypothetical protein F4818DRAFT_446808 [Hypoxylon cercidicola]|nr:hypothetical protein F4818DRAFT_446808 [Hypoxylon cercidicola]
MTNLNNPASDGNHRFPQRNTRKLSGMGRNPDNESHAGSDESDQPSNDPTSATAITYLSGPHSSFPVPGNSTRPPIDRTLEDRIRAQIETARKMQYDTPFPAPFVHALHRPPIRAAVLPQPVPPPRPQPRPQPRPVNHEGFVPMHPFPAAILRAGPLWEEQIRATGVSPFYRGNPFLAANQTANIPEDLNTALWITNLPPTCTHRQLLGSIRGCGKIYATVINPPEEDASLPAGLRREHTTSASKLVFFDRAGVDRLREQSRRGQFTVGGCVPRLRPNRIQSAPREPGPQCRVLHIEGPSEIVSEGFLHGFFGAKFTYELESVETLGVFGHITRQEWRFGSFRCQAESARQSIAREKDRHNPVDPEGHQRLWSQVMVHYGVDPCA